MQGSTTYIEAVAPMMKPRMAPVMCMMPMYNTLVKLSKVASGSCRPQQKNHECITSSMMPMKQMRKLAGVLKTAKSPKIMRHEAATPAIQPHTTGSLVSGLNGVVTFSDTERPCGAGAVATAVIAMLPEKYVGCLSHRGGSANANAVAERERERVRERERACSCKKHKIKQTKDAAQETSRTLWWLESPWPREWLKRLVLQRKQASPARLALPAWAKW